MNSTFRPGSKRKQSSMEATRVAILRRRYWQAVFIGWPALAQSFLRDLVAAGVKP